MTTAASLATASSGASANAPALRLVLPVSESEDVSDRNIDIHTSLGVQVGYGDHVACNLSRATPPPCVVSCAPGSADMIHPRGFVRERASCPSFASRRTRSWWLRQSTTSSAPSTTPTTPSGEGVDDCGIQGFERLGTKARGLGSTCMLPHPSPTAFPRDDRFHYGSLDSLLPMVSTASPRSSTSFIVPEFLCNRCEGDAHLMPLEYEVVMLH